MNTPGFPRMHVSLYVSSIEDTVRFYDQFFGQAADKVKPGYAKYMLNEPALVISFVENAAMIQPQFGHLGFQVETKEEMTDKLNVARTQGIVSLEEEGTSCCYAVQDKFWVSDPDGYRWEVYYFHADAEFNDPHYALEKAEACCSPAMETAEKPRVDLSNLTVKEPDASCAPNSGCC